MGVIWEMAMLELGWLGPRGWWGRKVPWVLGPCRVEQGGNGWGGIEAGVRLGGKWLVSQGQDMTVSSRE